MQNNSKIAPDNKGVSSNKVNYNDIKAIYYKSEDETEHALRLVETDIGHSNVKLINFIDEEGNIKLFKSFDGEKFSSKLARSFFGTAAVWRNFAIIGSDIIFADGYVCDVNKLGLLYEHTQGDNKTLVTDVMNIARERNSYK